jgi:hypothetical protein
MFELQYSEIQRKPIGGVTLRSEKEKLSHNIYKNESEISKTKIFAL